MIDREKILSEIGCTMIVEDSENASIAFLSPLTKTKFVYRVIEKDLFIVGSSHLNDPHEMGWWLNLSRDLQVLHTLIASGTLD